MITSSLHNHCSLCDGLDTPESMLIAANEAGIKDFGLSCHSYTDFDPDMSVESERGYIDRINELKNARLVKTRLYLGTEEDYFSPAKYGTLRPGRQRAGGGGYFRGDTPRYRR